jgi:murein DD-endopeptidase MepM/ murein hydrolase activator NlpD
MFYLCTAYGREGASDTFYEDFIACFLEDGDYQILANIEAMLGVSFSAQEKEILIRLTNEAVSTQHLPAGDIHALIGRLAAEDDTVYTEGAWGDPFHRPDYLSLITSAYGRRPDPFTGDPANHTGIDFGVSSGTAIYAVKPGRVIAVDRSNVGYGNWVAVSHGNGYASLYAHLSSINVTVGQTVGTNTVIARSGNSGRSTAPHLHLEIIVNGSPENPKRYLP